MKKETFLAALEIISEFHSTKIKINHIPEGRLVTDILAKPTIHITDCCAGVIDKLLEAGYSLSMRNGMTEVVKYGA